VEGPFGPELAGTIMAAVAAGPGQPASSQSVRVPARFLGVDGPRWFLRGVLTGPEAGSPSSGSASGSASAPALADAFGAIVVVRGTDPMPVREQLPLVLPPEAAAQLAPEQAGQQPGGPVTDA
jgi:hypothetical protein